MASKLILATLWLFASPPFCLLTKNKWHNVHPLLLFYENIVVLSHITLAYYPLVPLY